jgi:exodeoxyribonuclease-3
MQLPLTLVTWNVNSIRVRLEHVLRWLGDHRPDVLCLQETKVPDDQFPADAFTQAGYQSAYRGQQTYNGVAILSRHPVDDVAVGFDGKDQEEQKRLIAGTVRGIRIVNAYVPNGSAPDSDKFPYKLDFMAKLKDYLARQHQPGQPLALVGDFNAAMAALDVYDERALEGSVCYHPDERKRMGSLLDWGLTDAFRALHPEEQAFSWWDYRGGSFRKNEGLRIDHIWVTEPLARRTVACWIDRDERAEEQASDHVPVVATFTS